MRNLHLNLAYRRFMRDFESSLVNLIGLALGLTVTIVIAFYVKNELSYENGFENSGRIYRLTQKYDLKGVTDTHWAAIPPTIGLMVKEQVPEFEGITRLSLCKEQIISWKDKSFQEDKGCYVDNSFFSIFKIPWISGNSKTALIVPTSVVLSQKFAHKLFGNIDPVGQIITIDGDKKINVTGVIKDLPDNTHLKFDYFVSMPEPYSSLQQYGGWQNFYTYGLLKPSATVSVVNSKLSHFMHDYMKMLNKDGGDKEYARLILQPIHQIHLFSKLEKEIAGSNDMANVLIFSVVALLVLFVSCANYINLTIIKAIKRISEIGIKKTFGARKTDLIFHFFSESFIQVLGSGTLAVLVIYIIQTHYGIFLNLNIGFHFSEALIFIAIILSVTFLASVYPAAVISKYTINEALKGKRSMNTRFRKNLVIFQFVISIFLIICTISIHNQMLFIQNTNLGFDKKATIAVKLYGKFRNNGGTLKNELLKNSGVKAVSLTSYELGKRIGYVTFIPESYRDKKNLPDIRVLNTDGNLVTLLHMKIVEGADFLEGTQTPSVILNEAAVKALGYKSPINELVTVGDTKCKVVGVIRDFNYSSLHKKVEPLALTNINYFLNNMYVKVNITNIHDSLKSIETTIHQIAPDYSFSYSFLDETISKQYEAEQRMNRLFNIFAFLAIFIACLGLIVLSISSAELRAKEIGIRRVNGAKAYEILSMLNQDFIKWVTIAFVVACPIAWYAMQKWLQNFVYKTELSWWVFALAGIVAVAVSLLTVSWQSWRAAARNPVESLRYE